MSSLLRYSRRPGVVATGLHITLDDAHLRARAHACPGVPGMASVVVLDNLSVASPAHYHQWGRQLAALGFTHIRTGALAATHAAQAKLAGLEPVQQLSLLELASADLRSTRARHGGGSTRTLLSADLPLVARIDRAAFGDRWCLDATMLADVCVATPTFRARTTLLDGAADPLGGFLISGRAGRTGYVQRLAVHPDRHRQGLASALLHDSLRWMRRCRVQRVFVNTHVENEAALSLYRAHGFGELRERLTVLEGPIAP
jgi:[ribosomal protein S18]-alanine N-acetyltransferase